MDADQAAAIIIECIERFWSENKQPLLLSKLGTLVGDEARQVAYDLEGGLRAFIDAHLHEEIHVGQISGNETVVAAIPRRVVEDDDYEHLMADAGRTATAERFNPSFWAAFRKPLHEADRRFLTAQGTIRFIDQAPDAPQPPNTNEIPSDFIPDESANDAVVYQAASRWIQENGLPKGRFLVKPTSPSPKTPELPPDDLLGRIIVALDMNDVRQVVMPMEVVAKLRRTPI